jgi:hypothetical protein
MYLSGAGRLSVPLPLRFLAQREHRFEAFGYSGSIPASRTISA